MLHKGMSLRQWQFRMQENSLEHGESSTALMLIIEQGAVCEPCRENRHGDCTHEARDVIAMKPMSCDCEVCKVTPAPTRDAAESPEQPSGEDDALLPPYEPPPADYGNRPPRGFGE